MNIADKLDTVAQNVPKVYMAGAKDFGYKVSREGSRITFKNIPLAEQRIRTKLSSKNLFKAVNECISVTAGVKYWLTSGEDAKQKRINFWLYDADMNELTKLSQSIYGFYYGSSYGCWLSGSDASTLNFSFAFPEEVAYIKFKNAYADMQFEKSESPTPYTPYISKFSKLWLRTTRKNVVDMHNPNVFPTGGRFEIIDKTTVRNYGCAGYADAALGYYIYAPKGTKLTISFEYELGGEATDTWFTHRIGSKQEAVFKSGDTLTVGDEGYIYLAFSRSGGSGNDLLGWVDIKCMQVEVGTEPTEYEPFLEGAYMVNAEGITERVRLLFPITNISTDTEGVIVSTECFLDPNAVINELTDKIKKLGGEV